MVFTKHMTSTETITTVRLTENTAGILTMTGWCVAFDPDTDIETMTPVVAFIPATDDYADMAAALIDEGGIPSDWIVDVFDAGWSFYEPVVAEWTVYEGGTIARDLCETPDDLGTVGRAALSSIIDAYR